METDLQAVFDLLYVSAHMFALFAGWKQGGAR